MNLLRISVFSILTLWQASAIAQTEPAERQADFSVTDENEGVRFQPLMPPLVQKAGAPTAYYSYFWEFGDGSFSTEAQPLHRFAGPGDYPVSLDATAHYDNGKKAKKKKSKYDLTVKVPDGMTFEQLIKLAVTTPPLKKKK